MSSFIPNSFQIPNALIDSGIISKMSPNDLKCYLVVVRKTAGWHKEWDFIPTTQLMELTGIKKRQTIYGCMENLESFGLVESLKVTGKTTKYRLQVVPLKGTGTESDSSTVDGNGVVPLKGTGSSTVDGYTSKDTTKTTNTKNKKSTKNLPDNLNLEAFELWCNYKGSTYSQQGKTLSANKLAQHSHEVQMEMVESSIMNNYKGLFEPKQSNGYKPKEPEVGSIAYEMAQEQKNNDAIDVEVDDE